MGGVMDLAAINVAIVIVSLVPAMELPWME